MNPLGNIPIFISLTSEYDQQSRKNTARKAAIVSFIILTVFLFLGNLIFSVFGITIHAFRVAGGILIFGIAFNLLHAKTSQAQSPHSHEKAEAEAREDISITPLALPIMAGPGTIATVMARTSGHNVANLLGVCISYTVILVATYFLFAYSSPIIRRIGQSGVNVISRLMGLILAVMAIQMIADGVHGLFPHL
ncbi:MarC family protein [Metabacillus sp. GX 13764]|nr:MarC family protein [Metabacillus kandeliae]